MSISIIPAIPNRILATPVWPAKYAPLSFVIGAEVIESSETKPDQVVTQELTYPGEGFENISLPECMNGRIKRLKTIRTWEVKETRQIYLVKVAWELRTLEFFKSSREDLPAGAIQYLVGWSKFYSTFNKEVTPPHLVEIDGHGAYVHSQNVTGTLTVLLITRPREEVTKGARHTFWTETIYSAAWMVPPLDGYGLIPDCGGYSETSGWSSTNVEYGIDHRANLATIIDTQWRNEAIRVRDHFPWHYFEVGVDHQGLFSVRAAKLAATVAMDVVFPADLSKMYTGPYTVDDNFLWRPPPSAHVNVAPWRDEMVKWSEENFWPVVAQNHGGKGYDFNLDVAAVGGKTPAYQIKLTQNRPKKVWLFPNIAFSRVINYYRTEENDWMETRQLVHASYHPFAGNYQESVVVTGERIKSGDVTSLRPAYLVEAYERVV